ncbi:PREDICTED: glutamyl aminopeptidase-like, partial [Priapulus caudatus]|uniref:Glutamyl aminopeptidase-like n=1 Tax=Priapulus caudatus TaxID=37621 RepID=A0ABM1F5W6_PRICU
MWRQQQMLLALLSVACVGVHVGCADPDVRPLHTDQLGITWSADAPLPRKLRDVTSASAADAHRILKRSLAADAVGDDDDAAGSRDSGVNATGMTAADEETLSRLPLLARHIRPVHYALYILPDMDAGVAYGAADVIVDVTRECRFIFGNQLYLNFTETYVTQHTEAEDKDEDEEEGERGGRRLQTRVEYGESFWVLVTTPAMQPGRYRIHIEYEATMAVNSDVGFFTATYTSSGADTSYSYTGTAFEPTLARTAFPCFDEPHLKATFAVTLVHPGRPYYALSNMPAK